MSNIVTLAGKSVGVMLIALLAHNYFLFALINVLVFLASYLSCDEGENFLTILMKPYLSPKNNKQNP